MGDFLEGPRVDVPQSEAPYRSKRGAGGKAGAAAMPPVTKILALGRPTPAGMMEAIALLRPAKVRATLHLAG
jgi:hypothetical protein